MYGESDTNCFTSPIQNVSEYTLKLLQILVLFVLCKHLCKQGKAFLKTFQLLVPN